MYRFFSSFKNHYVNPFAQQSNDKNNQEQEQQQQLNYQYSAEVEIEYQKLIQKLLLELEHPSLGSRLRVYQKLYKLMSEVEVARKAAKTTGSFELLTKRFANIKKLSSVSHTAIKTKEKDDLPKITELKPLLRLIGVMCEKDEKNRLEFKTSGCISKLVELIETKQAIENYLVVAMQQIFLEDSAVS